MSRFCKLPLFPGNSFRDVSKDNFQKSQQWVHSNGIPTLSDRRRQDTVEMIELYPPKMAQNLSPGWLQYDKRVLCFDGYFRENVEDLSGYQIRSVRISFFLEDGTVQVIEPKKFDSGIPQGCIVKRQKVPSGDLFERKFLSVLDFNVAKPVMIFNREYHITDCDEFTRSFLNQLGIAVPIGSKTPIDPVTELRRRQTTIPIRNPCPKARKLAQFLQNDRKVLRFTAFWDNTEIDFGYVRDLTVLFYLSDNTVEIIENLPCNTGREETTQFLKRMKLPKNFSSITDMAFQSANTVLNVFGGGLSDGRFILDSKAFHDKDVYYTEKDLMIGNVLNVFGRNIILTDCDQFTKNFYKEKYGLEGLTPIEKPFDTNLIRSEISREKELPPFNGWGTHLDSEENCKALELKPPRENAKKFLTNENQILRFGAKMISKIKENSERIFTINYYLSDETISVYETPIRNSGFIGGQFLHRRQFFLPNQNLRSSARPRIYTPQHFYIGSRVKLSDHIFEVVSADCHVFDYMEKHQNVFPFSNIQTIMDKICEAIRPHYKTFIAKYIPQLTLHPNGVLTANFEMMKDMLIDLLKETTNTHEIITICRYFQIDNAESNKDKGSIIDWNKFIDYIGLEVDLQQDTN